uniref:Uncharacterized protein n=1 Tax=Anguilla anguilla TaxID=7936 RepID=A0A0E9SZJ7_ANGAN
MAYFLFNYERDLLNDKCFPFKLLGKSKKAEHYQFQRSILRIFSQCNLTIH